MSPIFGRKRSTLRPADSTPPKLIVGLGNPGPGYAGNRHNVGFMCVSHFAKSHSINFDRKKGNARVGEGAANGVRVVVARPQTYMNASGEAVAALFRRLRVGVDDLIVIHDDLDLPPGRMRIRKGGSSGGHNGVQSIIACVGSPDFTRIRVGIGHPRVPEGGRKAETDVIGHVLSGFTPLEMDVIGHTIPRVTEALDCLLSEGLMAAMNRFNSSARQPPE